MRIGAKRRSRDLARAPGQAWVFVLAALACLTWNCAVADSMRCGRKVIRNGDSPATLLKHCGEPIWRGKADADVSTPEGRRHVRVEQWHYKPSERSLERIVLIYRGEVVAVETGSR